MFEPVSNQNERKNQINSILQRDKLAFDIWIETEKPRRDLTIPHNALRFLIPTPAFDLVQDPCKVDVVIPSQPVEGFPQASFLVAERRNTPLSDLDLLIKYMKEFEAYKKRVPPAQRAKVPPPPIPAGVDPLHVLEYPLIEKGTLTLNDYIFNDVFFEPIGMQLRVDSYEDRADLHGLGFARSFYQKLSYAAKALGFRFITGTNADPGYFKNKLDRRSLDQVRPELRDEFCNSPETISQSQFTIEFLNEKDKTDYLI